jgi:lipopolysaccharide export LptBFGC system permease protein LptF
MSALKLAFLLGLIPQALPLALPAGLTFGVALGLTDGARSGQTAKDVAGLAVVTAVLCLLVVGWWMPVANQAFRQSIFAATGGRGVVMRGPNEMSFWEVNREAAVSEALGNVRQARAYRWSLHNRLALPAAAVALPSFLFFLSSTHSIARGLVAIGACFGYFILMISGGSLAASTVSAALAAWLPNLVFGGAALLMWRAQPRTNNC